MKKWWVLVLCGILMVSTAACTENKTGSSNSTNDISSASAPDPSVSSVPKYPYTDHNGVVHDGFEKFAIGSSHPQFAAPVLSYYNPKPAAKPLSEQKAKDIFMPLFDQALRIMETFQDYRFDHVENRISLIWNEKCPFGPSNYALVTDKELKTVEDVRKRASAVFTEDAISRCIDEYLNSNQYCPHFLEYKNKLYYRIGEKTAPKVFIKKSFYVAEQYEGIVVVKLETVDEVNKENIPCAFIMRFTDEGWRLDNAPYESYDDAFLQQFEEK